MRPFYRNEGAPGAAVTGRDPFVELAAGIAPGAREVDHWPLEGGVSAHVDALQFTRLRDVKPGETIFIENGGRLHSREHRGDAPHTPCIFEYVYFARPDSIIDNLSVYKARLRMGEQLAGQIVREWWSGISGTAISNLTGNGNSPD